jgi:ABC-type nitrate/sulfonate/bicarbonate transport system permease component
VGTAATQPATTVATRPRSRRAGVGYLLRQVLDRPLVYRLIPPLVLGLAWQAYASSDAAGFTIPTTTETFSALFELLGDSAIWDALWVSNQALILGFVAALALGVPLGLAMARYRIVSEAADPYISILVVMPIAALIPLFVMSVGIGLLSRVLLVALFALPMIVVNTQAGVRQVDPRLIEMGRSFLASERQLWRKVLLPGAMPSIMTGVRIGLGRAITGMVIAELLLVSVGVGELILNYRSGFNSASLYAVVIIVVTEAVLLIAAARALERRITPWARTGGAVDE